MSFRSLLISTATVTREVEDGFDDFGNQVATWDVVFEDVPCRLVERGISIGGGKEDNDDRTTITRSGTLFVEATTTLSALDRVEVNGETWEVVGSPAAQQNSVGVHHIETSVRLVVL